MHSTSHFTLSPHPPLLTHTHTHTQLEKLIEKNYYLHRSARDGYRSYLHSYASHSLKAVFNVEQLDLVRVARAFGFTTPPSVTLSILLCVCVGGGGAPNLYGN